MVSQTLSFIFITIIASTQSNGFLSRLNNIFNFINKEQNTLRITIYSQFMNMYFISATLLIRKNLPATYREIITKALGININDFNFYHHWFDILFLGSACISLLGLIIKRISNEVNRT